MKEWAGIFNDKSVWVQSENNAETKIFPAQTTKDLIPEEKDTIKEQAQPVIKPRGRYTDPRTKKRRERQDWSVGSTVNIGFATGLKVLKIYPPKMVYDKTTYLLQNKKGAYYYYEPYKGLHGPIDRPKDFGTETTEAPEPPKTVRLYHGETLEGYKDKTSPRWFSSSQAYAAGYANKAGGHGIVSYLDVPQNSPLFRDWDWDQHPTYIGEVPSNIAGKRKFLYAVGGTI